MFPFACNGSYHRVLFRYELLNFKNKTCKNQPLSSIKIKKKAKKVLLFFSIASSHTKTI